jgi:hypothetical protein
MTVPHVPVIEEGAETPATQEIPEHQRKAGTIPPGTYEAELREVAIVRRKKDSSHVLRMLVRTTELGRYAIAWQGLSENPDDPWDLTAGQLRGLRRVADRLCVPSLCEGREIVERHIVPLLGQPVTARVVRTPVGQTVTLMRAPAPIPEPETITVEGETVDLSSAEPIPSGVTVDLDRLVERTPAERAAREAQRAHVKLVEGQRGVRLSLALMAEGCHLLHHDEGWKHLGFETLSEYLAAPEIEISRTDFYRMVEIWSAYVLNGGVEPATLQGAGPSKLEVPLPALSAGVVTPEQAVADASSMTRKDLRSHYAGLMGAEDVEPKRRERPPVEITDEMVIRAAYALAKHFDYPREGAELYDAAYWDSLAGLALQAALNPNEETAAEPADPIPGQMEIP